jgi:hypothetical protein
MSVTRIRCASVLIALAWTLQPAPAQESPSWAERLRSEGLVAWDGVLADRLPVQGTLHVTRHFVTRTSEIESEVKANSECALYIDRRGKDTPTEVFGYNPRYAFRLRSHADHGWAVVSVHLGDASTDPAALNIRSHVDPYKKMSGYGFRIPHGLESLATYVRAPTTRVVSVTPMTWKGGEVVEVKLAITPATKKDEIRGITSLHDPSKQWRSLRTVVTGRREGEGGADDFELTTDYEYAPGPDSIVTSANELQTWKGADGKSIPVKVERAFNLKRLKILPDTSEFTLSAFGLPEPVGIEWPRRRSGWVWLAWAGAGCVVITLGFVALRRRAARRQAPAPATPA